MFSVFYAVLICSISKHPQLIFFGLTKLKLAHSFLIGFSSSLLLLFCLDLNFYSSFMTKYWVFNGWQSYVLDVHPFNPRIAMSAGYDGRTIVWDVSFFSFGSLNLNVTCSSQNRLIYAFVVYSFCRYGRAYLFGHMKLDILSWLMGSFLRKCLIE